MDCILVVCQRSSFLLWIKTNLYEIYSQNHSTRYNNASQSWETINIELQQTLLISWKLSLYQWKQLTSCQAILMANTRHDNVIFQHWRFRTEFRGKMMGGTIDTYILTVSIRSVTTATLWGGQSASGNLTTCNLSASVDDDDVWCC